MSVEAIEDALEVIFTKNKGETLEQCVSCLLQLIDKVFAKPDKKVHKINTKKKVFVDYIATCPGGVEFLIGCKFEPDNGAISDSEYLVLKDDEVTSNKLKHLKKARRMLRRRYAEEHKDDNLKLGESVTSLDASDLNLSMQPADTEKEQQHEVSQSHSSANDLDEGCTREEEKDGSGPMTDTTTDDNLLVSVTPDILPSVIKEDEVVTEEGEGQKDIEGTMPALDEASSDVAVVEGVTDTPDVVEQEVAVDDGLTILESPDERKERIDREFFEFTNVRLRPGGTCNPEVVGEVFCDEMNNKQNQHQPQHEESEQQQNNDEGGSGTGDNAGGSSDNNVEQENEKVQEEAAARKYKAITIEEAKDALARWNAKYTMSPLDEDDCYIGFHMLGEATTKVLVDKETEEALKSEDYKEAEHGLCKDDEGKGGDGEESKETAEGETSNAGESPDENGTKGEGSKADVPGESGEEKKKKKSKKSKEVSKSSTGCNTSPEDTNEDSNEGGVDARASGDKKNKKSKLKPTGKGNLKSATSDGSEKAEAGESQISTDDKESGVKKVKKSKPKSEEKGCKEAEDQREMVEIRTVGNSKKTMSKVGKESKKSDDDKKAKKSTSKEKGCIDGEEKDTDAKKTAPGSDEKLNASDCCETGPPKANKAKAKNKNIVGKAEETGETMSKTKKKENKSKGNGTDDASPKNDKSSKRKEAKSADGSEISAAKKKSPGKPKKQVESKQ